MADSMIAVEGITKRYGAKVALNNLSFNVERGDFFGFLGPNGSGKTTTIKAMIGLVRPDTGRVLIDGLDVAADPLAIRTLIGYVPDSPFVYGKLSGREFIRFVGGLYRMTPAEIEKGIVWLCDIFDMHDWVDRRCEEYSHGMKQKVVMSAAFIHHPRLIIVDEPTVGLDPASKRLLKDMLTLIRSHGTTVFMSSHDLAEVEELCAHLFIIREGTIVASGTIDDLRSQAAIKGGNLEDLFLTLTRYAGKTAYLDE